ncbi:MAG: hypothetical protein UT22_C0016G0006 [Parcubacteria group bacterium GW2011_GWC2_39_11]|nr:MAG: hypothetical protein UT22_C0016G0006 [Parcubacteria group bacterium GW2011_GWC2_39_11]
MTKKLSFSDAAYEILRQTNEALSSVELVDSLY